MDVEEEIRAILRKSGQTKAQAFQAVTRLALGLGEENAALQRQINELKERQYEHKYPCTRA
jgi:hypothetical protein